MRLKLTIPGEPIPKQSVRARAIGKGKKAFIQFYQTKEIMDAEKRIALVVKEQLPQGFVLWTKGIRINKLHYVFPPLKSFSKKLMEKLESERKADESDFFSQIEIESRIYKTTKPDLTDNLSKLLMDSLEGIVFKNDSQICCMDNVKKYYGLKPCTIIEMEEING